MAFYSSTLEELVGPLSFKIVSRFAIDLKLIYYIWQIILIIGALYVIECFLVPGVCD